MSIFKKIRELNSIPKRTVKYPFPDWEPWDIFPLGAGVGYNQVNLNVSITPHTLLTGLSQSGKSLALRSIAMHALQSPEWRVVIVDLKRLGFLPYRNHPYVLDIATELDAALSLIEQIEQEMQFRYIAMQEEGVNFFKNLENPPPAILLIIDELYDVLAPEKIRNNKSKERDDWRTMIGLLIDSIARIGRAAGIHMILATKHPDIVLLSPETKANIDSRIVIGPLDLGSSKLILNTDDATRILDIKGHGLFAYGNKLTEFQVYFLPEDQLDLVLEMASALATKMIGLDAFME